MTPFDVNESTPGRAERVRPVAPRGRVLVADELSARAAQVLRDGGLECDERTDISAVDLAAVIADYDGLLVRSRTRVTEAILGQAARLRIVGRAGIGVDNVDVPAATRRGVLVVNTPQGNATTTAEHAIALLMALARFIPQASASTLAGRWEKKRFLGHELEGQVLGVYGFGNIGRIVVDRGLGLRMKVIVHDPFVGEEAVRKAGAEPVSRERLLAESDYLSLHLPLTDGTRGAFDRATLLRMKPTAGLINCARGGIVDEAALYEVMASGHLAGAALDVFATEPPPADHPLFSLPNVIATPHLGASTAEAQEKVAYQVAEEVVRYFATGTVRNPVNAPRIAPELYERLAPFVPLAHALGRFVAQLAPPGSDEITVQFAGPSFERERAVLLGAALEGYLAHGIEGPVNAVNARLVAAERGITLTESYGPSPAGAYRDVIRVMARRRGERPEAAREVSGTLREGAEPRVVRVNGMPVDLVAKGDLLVLENEDRPGVVGAVGTILGQRGVNISHLQVGLLPGGRGACSFWNLDTPVDEDALGLIRRVPNVSAAQNVRL